MPFTCVETWDAHHAPREGVRRPAQPILGERAALFVRQGSATALTILIHLFLLWLLVSKLIGGTADQSGAGASGEGLTLLDLSGPMSAASQERAVAEAVPVQPTAPAETELDTSTLTQLPKSEWSMTRIAAPAEPQRSPPPPAAFAAVNGNGSIGGGAAPYDPFAGAAPLRRDPAPSGGARAASMFGTPPAQAGASGPEEALILDRAALDLIVARVSRQNRRARGSAEILVQVAPDGTILDASAAGGTASDEAKRALRRALIGQALYWPISSPTQVTTLSLPTIRLG